MSDKNPLVAFGLLATSIALKARTGQLRAADKINLMMSCLQWCEDRPDARLAVREFMLVVDTYPKFAGERLQSAILEMPGTDVGRDALPVLNAMQAEVVLNGWEKRKDCGHG